VDGIGLGPVRWPSPAGRKRRTTLNRRWRSGSLSNGHRGPRTRLSIPGRGRDLAPSGACDFPPRARRWAIRSNAVTAFPYAVDGQMLVPAGDLRTGTKSARFSGRGGSRAGLKLLFHFTTLIYPSGYTVLLPGAVDNVPGHGAFEDEETRKATIRQGQRQRPRCGKPRPEAAATGGLIGAAGGRPSRVRASAARGGSRCGEQQIALFSRGKDLRLEQGNVRSKWWCSARSILMQIVCRGEGRCGAICNDTIRSSSALRAPLLFQNKECVDVRRVTTIVLRGEFRGRRGFQPEARSAPANMGHGGHAGHVGDHPNLLKRIHGRRRRSAPRRAASSPGNRRGRIIGAAGMRLLQPSAWRCRYSPAL